MVAPITVKLNADSTGLSKGLAAGSKSIALFGQQVGVTLPPKLNLAVQGTKALLKVTKTVGTAAKDAAAEEQIFQQAMSNVTGESQDYNAALESTINASMKKAFTDTETRKALVALTTATGDSATATDLLTSAQDIARVAGVDLETAADAVAKAYAGQDTALLRMLPGLQQGTDAMGTIKNATDLAAGASDAYATSSQAAGDKARIAFSELAETIGGALGPALKDLGAALKPLLAALGQLASVILPPLLKLLGQFIETAARVASAITRIVEAVTRLISKIKELLGPLTDAIGKLKDFNILGGRSFNAPAMATAAAPAVGTRGLTAPAMQHGGGVTINIYGDPSVIEARVTKALRDYARRNGAGAVFTPERK